MIDVEQTIISQYGNSATITQLVRNMNEYLDPRADIDAFFDFVWNVDTAQGFGLDIWGRIVNISRLLTVPETPQYFGFDEAGNSAYPFGEAPFYNGLPPSTQTYKLSDTVYRQLILLKALANISRTTAPAINQLLQNLFSGPRTYVVLSYTPLDSFVLDQDHLDYDYATATSTVNRCYVNDLGNMRLRYTFEFDLEPWEFAIVTQSGALPRPAGVSVILFQSALPLFGFSEAGQSAAPFGQGVFVPQGAINAAI